MLVYAESKTILQAGPLKSYVGLGWNSLHIFFLNLIFSFKAGETFKDKIDAGKTPRSVSLRMRLTPRSISQRRVWLSAVLVNLDFQKNVQHILKN